MLWLFSTLLSAQAGEFMDIWVTTAFEDTNVLAGPDLYSPSANFVQRGNVTFFENYERRVTDDISRSNLVLYNKSEGFNPKWWTESAFILRYTPFLNPDMTQPGTNIRDDGSYVRIVRRLKGDGEGSAHNISLTGFAVDSGRFRLGYSYDLTWGARSIFSFDPGAVPGCVFNTERRTTTRTSVPRLQWVTTSLQKQDNRVTKPIMDCWWCWISHHLQT